MTVKLKDIVDALEMTDDTSEAFLNKRTGEIEWIGEYMDEKECEEVSDRLDEDGFIRLPTQYDIHEYSIMRNFVDSLPENEQDYLANAIVGRGAFQRFKQGIRRFGLEQIWYDFHDKAYVRIAKEWCEENGLEII